MSVHRRLARAYRGLRAAAAEVHYARLRVYELRTGQTVTEQTRAREARREIQDLNDLFTTETIS